MLFQAAPDMSGIYNERLAVVLGFISLLLAIAAFLSCRSCLAIFKRFGLKDPMKIRGYPFFNKFHLYYWWAFGVVLVAHLMIAVLHTGLPQVGDLDAPIHWRILAFGLFGTISSIFMFSSCRVIPRLVSLVKPGNIYNNKVYRGFFKYHSYYWLIFALLVAAHFLEAYHHVGVWPGG